ncbi:uncharacterized protein LOC113272791 [Papaver somniferum]|uniref:uncharacterized protein LOC113272791 n=1 Tax=Papaver somniferum TaxID=3469 RepID=UPI000E6FEAA2|nr:uncharacterized protein LOC113272791 [Papaver somniferum]
MVKKGEGKTFTLRGFNVTHTCNGDKDDLNNIANPKYASEWYYENMKTELGINEPVPCPDDLATQFNKSRRVNIKYHIAWRARVKVLEKLHGSYEKSYQLVHAFCEMVNTRNPGSIATFSYGTTDNTFLSMTICFKATVEGLLFDCRMIISLDACHLNGKHGSVLLHATGLDGQNGLVPLGMMVCRIETVENWKIFLEDLQKLLGYDFEFTFISDKHLMAYFKKYYKGYSIQTHLWNAANFQQHMDDVEAESEEVERFLIDERPETWSKAHFTPTRKCEHINNNFSEYFNNMTKKLRDETICKMGLMYCVQYYWVDSYKRTYTPEFNPLLGPEDYEKTAKKEMMKPPVNIRKTGRPGERELEHMMNLNPQERSVEDERDVDNHDILKRLVMEERLVLIQMYQRLEPVWMVIFIQLMNQLHQRGT